MKDRIESILEFARDAANADYSRRLELLEKAAQKARALCRKLTRNDAKHARSVLVTVLEMPLVGKCAPQCCNASYVTAVEVQAKCEVLATWKQFDPDAVLEISPALMAQLIAPYSRRIALATVELVERSPEGRRFHSTNLGEAVAHPRWQVTECAARALGKLGVDAPEKARMALAEALRHEQWQVRRAAAKALGIMTEAKHVALEHAAKRDRHKAVRYAACKATGRKLQWP